jgi:hypothetical protein
LEIAKRFQAGPQLGPQPFVRAIGAVLLKGVDEPVDKPVDKLWKTG